MRILIATPIWPHPEHGPNAVSIVTFQLILGLAKQARTEVEFLNISRTGDPQPDGNATAGLRAMSGAGVRVHPALRLDPPPPRRPAWRRALRAQAEDFFPETRVAGAALEAVERIDPDLVLVPWSEWLTAVLAPARARKFAYYGNPVPKAARAAAIHELEETGNRILYGQRRLQAARLERIHLGQMMSYAYLGDVAANDAAWYAEKGHPNAFYVRNVWIDRFPDGAWRPLREKYERADRTVIVGNVGRTFATANSFGLRILGRDVAPALARAMNGRDYEIHVLGAGRPRPSVERFLRRPEIVMRGFVDDIDREILSAQIFLCLNNASPYKVGHTRYLHAWSLGACVVAHRDASLSMPEIVHGENALLGGTAEEIAELVAEAAADAPLRRRLAENGYQTFRDFFTAGRVAENILARVPD